METGHRREFQSWLIERQPFVRTKLFTVAIYMINAVDKTKLSCSRENWKKKLIPREQSLSQQIYYENNFRQK